MNSLGDNADGTQGLNENSLPVELQSKNILNPAYAISTSTNGLASSKVMHSKQEQPYIVLNEQPQQRGFRFRYECEGPSHGGLQGVKTERSRKSFPSIKIENYTGAARIVVSLVTDEKSPRPHAHKLVGSNCANGSCTIDIKSCLDVISFPNLCVLHVTRKKLVDVLTERIMDSIRLSKKLKNNNMNIEPEITDDDRRLAKAQASDQAKSMQLSVVRLCFQVFLKNSEGAMYSMLTPVVSHPIYDSKAPGASALKICRMDKYSGCCSGNEEVFLLCEKVQKDDIQVRFVEQNGDGSVKWEALGNFGPLDVHRQYAIVFKTPPYWNSNIDKSVNVLIMLQRKSDLEVSEPKAFTYLPQNRDKDNIASKKRKRIPLDGYDFGGGDGSGLGGVGLGGDGGGGGGGGGAGGIGGPGGGGGENIIYVLNRNDDIVNQQRPLVPGPVEEAIREESIVLESERLAFAVSQQALIDNGEDPWITCDSDIEVDGVSISPSRKIETGKEKPSKEKLTLEEPKDTAEKHLKKPSHISFKDNIDSDKKSEQKKSQQETSPEWLDSGVDPDTPKSISSFDEKKSFKLGTKESDQISPGTRSTETAESEEKVDDNQKPGKTNLSDTHSEPDAKTDVVSVGVKSDEGFSETSDETGVKGQQIAKSKTERTLETSVPGTCGNSHLHCSELTNTVRQVTERVAERTVAALSDYAETGDIRHLLLVQRHLMAVSNENGDLPLHLAVINNQPEALKNLLDVMSTLKETKRHINAINMLRQTPLHLATVMQSQAMVETLLHSGADTTISDRNGNTAAHLAVMNNSTNCLRSLVKYLRPGATKLDPFPELDYLNYDGYSPVHLAAQCGSVSMLEILVYGQADVDLPDGKSGKTALHHAVDNDDLSVADYLLLQAHTDLNARCFDGNTALHIACARQLVGMVALLVSAGADTQCENEEIPDPDVGQEDGTVMDRRGLQPRDYAENNEQILRILSGRTSQGLESGPAPSSHASEDDSANEDLTEKMGSVSLEQKSLGSLGYQSMGGKMSRDSGVESIVTTGSIHDLNAIGIRTRIEISRLLDPHQPGKDVLALTEKMGYQSLLETLEGAKAAGTSPTTFLLEYLENVDGNLASLRDGLKSIDRMDVLSLILPAV